MEQNEIQNIGETIVKGKRPGKSDQMKPKTEPGDNKKYLQHALEVAKFGRVDLKDAQKVEKRTFDYFSLCEQNDMKPSVAGLALAYGIDRKEVWRIRMGQGDYPTEVRRTVKNAVQILNSLIEDYMQNGKINPVSGIFLMKNNMDYTDKQEVEITPKSPLGDVTDMRQLEEKYRDSVVIDTDGTDVTE